MIKVKYVLAVVLSLLLSGTFVAGAARAADLVEAQQAVQQAQKAVDAAPNDAGLRIELGKAYMEMAMGYYTKPELRKDPATPEKMRGAARSALEEFVHAYDLGDRSNDLLASLPTPFNLLFTNNKNPGDDVLILARKALDAARLLETVPPSGETSPKRWEARVTIILSLTRAIKDEAERTALFNELQDVVAKMLPDASPGDREGLVFAQGLASLEEARKSSDPVLRKKRHAEAETSFRTLAEKEDKSGNILARMLFMQWARLDLDRAMDAPSPEERDVLLKTAEEKLVRSEIPNVWIQAEIAAVRGNVEEALRSLKQVLDGAMATAQWRNDFVTSIKDDKYFAPLLGDVEFKAFLSEVEQKK